MLLASTKCNFLKLMKITDFLHGKKMIKSINGMVMINNLMKSTLPQTESFRVFKKKGSGEEVELMI